MFVEWIEEYKKLQLLNAPPPNDFYEDYEYGSGPNPNPDDYESKTNPDDIPEYSPNTPEYDIDIASLWTRCDHCGAMLFIKHLKENQSLCLGCGAHLRMNSPERIHDLIDEGTWRPLDETVSPCDPLEFYDRKQYTERLEEAQERTGFPDAIQTGTGLLDNIPVALGVMDFNFLGGSMGSVVGEKITRLIEYATQAGLPLILVCASGGARMQEGILSLMQMAKISAALHVHQNCAKLLYISVITSPTTGGVSASFAMLGDLILAEPNALIGFAGRRVIEQTLQEELPANFQTSEYLMHHGLLDIIVPRVFLKQALSETNILHREAPLKISGYIPYGERGPLTKTREEQMRRFSRRSKEAEYKTLLEDFQFILSSLMDENSLTNLDDIVFPPAVTLACQGETRTSWLTPSVEEFQVKSQFSPLAWAPPLELREDETTSLELREDKSTSLEMLEDETSHLLENIQIHQPPE